MGLRVVEAALLVLLFIELAALQHLGRFNLGPPADFWLLTLAAAGIFVIFRIVDARRQRPWRARFALLPLLLLAIGFLPAAVFSLSLELHRSRVALISLAGAAYVLLIAPLIPTLAARLLRRSQQALGLWMLLVTASIVIFLGVAGGRSEDGEELAPFDLKRPPRTNLVLISVDTTRADYLESYGFHVWETSPNLRAMSEEGVLFEQALAQAPHTHSSMASLMTSVYPIEHRSIAGRPHLTKNNYTLAEHLRRCGYRTGAFLDNPYLTRELGFDQGYETFQESAPLGDVLQWLQSNHQSRFFLHVHWFHPHGPYEPVAPWTDEFSPGYSGPLEEASVSFLHEASRRWPHGLDDQSMERMRALYAAEIRAMDEDLGALLAHLRSLGREEDTLVVFVADHGEEFLDHGGLSHGHTLYDELLRVPLVLKLPEALPPGRRIGEQVELVDVIPTVLDILSLPPLHSQRGESYLPMIQGEAQGPPPDPFAVAQLYRLRGRHHLVARTHEWKLHVSLAPTDEASFAKWELRLAALLRRDYYWDQCQLFHISEDPRETRDLAERHPEVVEELLRRLEEWRVSQEPQGYHDEGALEVSPEALERIRSLGYGG